MEITNNYEIVIENTRHFVCEGTCDGIPTLWVTKTKWNGNIVSHIEGIYVSYTDEDGNEILSFDERDEEYKLFKR